MHKPIVIGVTGGFGSGKTSVRDMKARGRSIESVIEQYVNVIPIHNQVIEPTKR